jgi:hypothetical protein
MLWRRALALAGMVPLLCAAGPSRAQEDPSHIPPPFSFSSFAAQDKTPSSGPTPAKGAALYKPPGPPSSAKLVVGSNTDIITGFDVIQQAIINGTSVNTCNPGMETAQNETCVAVNPANASNLVAGANDYRLYEPTENRYDGSGGFYLSTNGGVTWSAGFLPGLVLANAANPGPYESAGDPSVSAGPSNNFWYANLAFNRSDNANSVAVSHSVDGGSTWATSFVLQTSAAAGTTLFNDKEWIAADPTNANKAYVTWTQFHTTSTGNYLSSPIVISKTTDGGLTWSAPQALSSLNNSQGSVVQVDSSGTVHVVYETYYRGQDRVAYSYSTNGGATFQTKIIGTINDIPSPLPGGNFRTNSFPAFAIDGSTLHVVWSNWNGSNADVVYIRSTNSGASWSAPVTVAGGAGDQFFPWVAANSGKAYVSWLNRASSVDIYTATAIGSTNSGGSWSSPVTISSGYSIVANGNLFGFPNCAPDFIGDYTGIAVGSDGVAHPVWTDIRVGNDPTTTTGTDQDPYTAPLTLQ